eukprot:4943766-Pleurochrysis_carterae.AAC.3
MALLTTPCMFVARAHRAWLSARLACACLRLACACLRLRAPASALRRAHPRARAHARVPVRLSAMRLLFVRLCSLAPPQMNHPAFAPAYARARAPCPRLRVQRRGPVAPLVPAPGCWPRRGHQSSASSSFTLFRRTALLLASAHTPPRPMSRPALR